MTDRIDRRRFAAIAAAALAGCTTRPGTASEQPTTGESGPDTVAEEGTTGGGPTGTTSSPSTTSRDAPATSTRGGALDLREANVTGVAVERSGDEHQFAVTLYHDDDGEDGYANWWQVETLDGEELGRRDLLHAHGTREFTRSDGFELPDVDCVVVRGHDRTHGYGGQAMLVTLATGATRAVPQGSERRSFAGADCP